MSAPTQAARKRHEINRFDLEGAITDLEGDSLLLGLAIDDINRQTATFPLPAPPKGIVHLALTDDQVLALGHARVRLEKAVEALKAEFYGPEGDQ